MNTIPRPALATALVTACLLAGAPARAANPTAGPLEISAFVTETFAPNTVVFTDNATRIAATREPLQTVELLHESPLGGNASGRSPNIRQAFASAAAASDGNGGAGVSMAATFGLGGLHQLASTATFSQLVTNNGPTNLNVALQLHIPQIEVGLLNVPPFTSALRATELAQASASVESIIHRADGTQEDGIPFEFGLRIVEKQIELGPNTFANSAVPEFLFTNVSGSFDLNRSDDPAFPRFSFDPVDFTPVIATLRPGDSVEYTYALGAFERTVGGEFSGGFGFVGDPFSLVGGPGNLTPIATEVPSVPEPGTGMLAAAALLAIAWRVRRRRPDLEPQAPFSRPPNPRAGTSRSSRR